MKFIAALLPFFVLALHTSVPQQDRNQTECCKFVQQALQASRSIKPGMTRNELEEHFYEDGGAQIRDETRYAYRECSYIRVDVSFKLAPSKRPYEFSPDDVVIRISKPYLDYPTVD